MTLHFGMWILMNETSLTPRKTGEGAVGSGAFVA